MVAILVLNFKQRENIIIFSKKVEFLIERYNDKIIN